jgi:fructosamine-3-kinase
VSTAAELARLTGREIRSVRVIGGQHGSQHLQVMFADGQLAFAKTGGATGALIAEANGLRWLAEAGAVPVPEVFGVDETALVISMVPATGRAGTEAAYAFGADLARMHAYGADTFGAPWPGFIASLPLDNTAAGSWPAWYAERRLAPFLRLAVSSGALRAREGAVVEAVMERLAASDSQSEPPSRIHGDCWNGNVLWSGDRGWLIDPAAHGGHRETDLAMLALFGAPDLEAIIAGYESVAPLAPGWRSRVPLHQLHPLLVHACLFGESYRSAVVEAARVTLESYQGLRPFRKACGGAERPGGGAKGPSGGSAGPPGGTGGQVTRVASAPIARPATLATESAPAAASGRPEAWLPQRSGRSAPRAGRKPVA